MTNKITKDYISLLLGCSRKKEYTNDGEKNKPVEPLKQDKGVGDSFAKKALGGRGLLGRLKQKLFAGQQKSESISVAFQLADPNDGWEFVESEKTDVGADQKGKEDEKNGGGGGSSSEKSGGSGGSSGNGGSAGGGSSGGSSGGAGGSGGNKTGAFGGKGGGTTPFGLQPNSPMLAPITAQQAQKNPNDATMNLAARVKRLEDEVGITPPTSESTDPFYDVFMGERMEMVKLVCEGKSDAGELINAILEEQV
jgi:hypothetical protein